MCGVFNEFVLSCVESEHITLMESHLKDITEETYLDALKRILYKLVPCAVLSTAPLNM